MKIPFACLVVFSMLAAAFAFAGGARAPNWCSDASVTVQPSIYTPGVPGVFAVIVQKTTSPDLNLTGVTVRFSFESSDRVLSSTNVTISAYGSESFQTPQVTAPSGGTSFTIVVKLEGYPDGNPADTGTCTKTSTIQTINAPGGGALFAGALILIVAFAILVIVVVVIIVVVVVVVTRKKAPTQPYPPQYPPPAPPPYAPPGQGPGPPQQPPMP